MEEEEREPKRPRSGAGASTSQSTTQLKPAWLKDAAGASRDWLKDQGLQGDKWRLLCTICNSLIQSRLGTIKLHEDGKKHKEAVAAATAVAVAKHRGLTLFGREAAEQQHQVALAAERSKYDEATVGQLKSLLYTLNLGRPLTDYEKMPPLYESLRSPDIAGMHWGDNAGWELAEAMAHCLVKRLAKKFVEAPFFSVSMDEATAIDTTSYLSVHGYLLVDWEVIPFFIKLQQVGLLCALSLHSLV
jgi:hypothetical protein